MIAAFFHWALFASYCGISFFGSIALAAWLLRLMLERIFEVATLIEASREALLQGRAPIMRCWRRLKRAEGDVP